MVTTAAKPDGLRERKRQLTLQRISEAGLRLFLAKGYEATSLDEIAAAAGISRRTFFYYFESKDEILRAYIANIADTLKSLIVEGGCANRPLLAVHQALLTMVERDRDADMAAIAKFMRSQSNATLGRDQTRIQQLEVATFEGLCELWPARERRNALRIVAMASMGALRLAVDDWLNQEGKRPLTKYIGDAFKQLQAEI